MVAGRVTDTYVAALQHGLADIPEETTCVGVVRRPTPWFYGQVDENIPALAPPEPLLDEVKATHEQLQEDGLEDAEAHNRALEAVDYDARYRAHLETPDADAAIESLRERVEDGEDVALVCYENTEEKGCHRTILRAELESRLADREKS